MVNSNVCLNSDQARGVIEILIEDARNIFEGKVLKRKQSFNKEAKLLEIVTLINSFRNECKDCLRENCDQKFIPGQVEDM